MDVVYLISFSLLSFLSSAVLSLYAMKPYSFLSLTTYRPTNNSTAKKDQDES
ncbi:unnamed protein product [Periconia digitata]|uniref:Uncharacterized protein n=1 Tax=Periconia digitata TaxID=1303443 RepID=A0A9W4XJ93_9PLEO|nr:unnamed protein product [Periconia digitata]